MSRRRGQPSDLATSAALAPLDKPSPPNPQDTVVVSGGSAVTSQHSKRRRLRSSVAGGEEHTGTFTAGGEIPSAFARSAYESSVMTGLPHEIESNHELASPVASEEESSDDSGSDFGLEEDEPDSDWSNESKRQPDEDASSSRAQVTQRPTRSKDTGKGKGKGKAKESSAKRTSEYARSSEEMDCGTKQGVLDLSLAIVAHIIEQQDDEWVAMYASAVRNGAKTLGSGDTWLDPEEQAVFERAASCCGFREEPLDPEMQRMIESNRAVLLSAAQGDTWGLSLERAVQHHLYTAEYLLGRHSRWNKYQARDDIETLKADYADWTRRKANHSDRDRALLKSLTQGAGSNLRARMWSILGWQRTVTYNSRVGKLTFQTKYRTQKRYVEIDELRRTSMDQACAMLAFLFPGRAKELKSNDSDPYHFKSQAIQSLRLLRDNWQKEGWHEEGKKIALVQLTDEFGGNLEGGKGDRPWDLTQFLKDGDGEELKRLTAIQNLRVLLGTRPNVLNQGQWKRVVNQLCLNTECLRRTTSSRAGRPDHFEEGTKLLTSARREPSANKKMVDALTRPRAVLDMRNFVSSQLNADWTAGWHFESMDTDLED